MKINSVILVENIQRAIRAGDKSGSETKPVCAPPKEVIDGECVEVQTYQDFLELLIPMVQG